MDTQSLTTTIQFFAGNDAALEALRQDASILVIDALPEAIEDLFKILFPYIAPGSPEFATTFRMYQEEEWNEAKTLENSTWAYFPWKRTLVHLPKKDIYYTLRTARNKFLITAEEQDKFSQAHIGIAGMSVGSSVLNAIVLSGGGANLRLADHDTLSITNLNRLFGSVCDLTVPKLVAAMRRTYEIDPYTSIMAFDQGLREEDFERFFEGDHKLDLFIEEIDDIQMKVLSRRRAKQLRIPVVMATDNGDNTIIDVERYDLEPDYPLFHGRADEALLNTATSNPSQADKVRLASTIVGSDVTPRTRYSLTMVGQKLPSWPQLGNAAILSGAATSYVARRILAGDPMPSGRYEVNFDKDIDVEYNTPEATTDRETQKQEFLTALGLIYGGSK